MRSEIKRDGVSLRPSVNWRRLKGRVIKHGQATGEMIESLRNLSESYFADMFTCQQEMLRVLRRIDRRLAKSHPLK